MTAYALVKFVHVFLAIVAVGFNASYAIWLGRSSGRPEQGAVLRGIKVLDDYFANPAYILLLVTGLALVLIGHLSLRTFWITASLVLWLVAIAAGYGLYTPTLRRQVRILEATGADSAEYQALDRRGTVIGIGLAVIVVVIVFLMVTKPAF